MTVFELLGLAIVVVGIALWSIPAAVIAAGGVVFAVGHFGVEP